jgi:hypothetical protein
MPFYRKKLKELDVTPADFTTPQDVAKPPFAQKKQICGITSHLAYSRATRRGGSTASFERHQWASNCSWHTARDIANWTNMMARYPTMVCINHTDVF